MQYHSLKGKTALITGASAGIGEACARVLAKAGANLVLLARREEKLKKLAQELRDNFSIECEIHQVDMRHRSQVEAVGKALKEGKKTIDILINNAGLARGTEKLHQGNIDDWEEMIDTNIKGLLYITRTLVPEMLKTSREPQVINIGSTAGIHAYSGGAVYCSTKSAVGFLSDGLRIDAVDTPLRVCNIRPGLVETEFSVVRFHGDQNRADKVYQDLDPLYAPDIADAVEYVVTRPPHVQVSELTVMPSCQGSPITLHRKQ